VNTEPSLARLQTRKYIYNTLFKIFGPSSSTVLLNRILKNGLIFGGTCDAYKNVYVKAKETATTGSSLKIEDECAGGLKEAIFPLIGSANIGRESWRVRTCQEVTNISESVAYARQLVED